jgi:hypothetical protein
MTFGLWLGPALELENQFLKDEYNTRMTQTLEKKLEKKIDVETYLDLEKSSEV